MIKLFRNIRQRLLSENKFSKYMLYAIGEIILVVIGILIALQINNWNENRKSDIELQLITQNLVQEFEANREALQNALSAVTFTKNGSLDNLSLIESKNNLISKEQLNIMIEKSLFFPTWIPSNFTMNELNNTGKLSLLKNDNLKQLLFSWETQIEVIEEWNRRLEKSSQDIIDYIKHNGSLRNLNFNTINTKPSNLGVNNSDLFDNIIFENLLDEKVLYAQFMENQLKKMSTIIETILKETKNQ
ncbi:hypothetical protein [Winogradskyella thalassocola]|uniref:Uncharacterized protein n=1 Tax=Winogradskyella thalassocola TaxID=262004 RepID=A0A1G7Z7M9_9FLAO|nr:hypothetical protein [Winogradskyella thalassocola]SDH04615.1 hypothetical protein SAMN04489796_1011250 [Winogradskyella thalassocola]